MEPDGGTQNDPEAAFASLDERLQFHLAQLRSLSIDQLLEQRYRKFRNIAQFYTSETAEVHAEASASV
jgi:acetyl-CoA carboxylase carboxyl transferase subunit alpha